jgi:superfamily II DNA or RNA helicase
LVKTRGREWVVLPDSEEDLLMLRPLGGTEDEVVGVYLPLESVEPAQFPLPTPEESGDFRSGRLLRDAVRLGFRSSAGPFRSFARIGVEPRPYQLVPLLMALKLDPVRLLIADDVGIGKTVEAGLIARELLDRGEVHRLAVLCPPQLAEQWQAELSEKFHIAAELVLPSTATKLERNCRVGQSLFDLYSFVVVSTDFIKTERRLAEFARTCPELVIVDEAHTCAYGGEGRSGRHQRQRLISGLAAAPNRHLILLSATPHSGNESAFRSLLTFLKPQFGALPEDLSGPQNEAYRRQLAGHFVQRRRADIRAYLHTDTPFPEREEKEETYRLSEAQKLLFDKALRFARETVLVREGDSLSAGVTKVRQRVRWWSALALLRSLASSPAAAVATLRNRAANAEAETPEEADVLGRRSVLDLTEEEAAEGIDVTPGSDTGEDESAKRGARRRLLEMAREAEALMGEADAKLQRVIPLVRGLVAEGYSPIVFCRYIPTAEYVAAALRTALRGVDVGAVTGSLPPTEREARVLALGQSAKRVLVCTDCLSEGINLQVSFDAVIHYDLSWNPTRHEQREGRVDRYGQPRKTVRVVTYYGTDNQIDGIVLDVLVRKHKAIRSSLGISVPVPVDSDSVVEAIFEGLLLRGSGGASQTQLSIGFDDLMKQERDRFHQEWDNATAREKRSRTVFAQETIKPDEVAQELAAVRAAIGSGVDVASFMTQALRDMKAFVSPEGESVAFDLSETSQAVKEAMGGQTAIRARFALPVGKGETYLSRTHPITESLAAFVLDSSLDPLTVDDAFLVRPARCGVTRTDAVTTRTTLLLVRFRYHIVTRRDGKETALLAEDLATLAFTGSPTNAVWLSEEQADALVAARPTGNVPADQAATFLQRVVDGFDSLTPHLEEVARERGEELLIAHRRVRTAARLAGVQYRVESQLPPDVLAMYVFLPGGA